MTQQRYNEFSDEELITMFRDGDSQIMDYLLNKYKDLVRKKAQSMFLLGGETEDLIQEGMIGLFQAVMDYDCGRDASFATFATLCMSRKMYTAIKVANGKNQTPLNYYVSFYEKAGSEESEEVSAGKSLEETLAEASIPSPEEHVISNEIAECLKAAVENELSPFERDAFALSSTGASCREVAGILGKDVKSTDNAIQRSKNKLRKILEQNQLLG